MSGQNSSPPAWVAAFFSGANTLRWSDIQAGMAPDDWAPEILAWLTLLDREEDAAGVFPHVDANDTVVWYGVARSNRGARRLAEDLGGFVGATYGGFNGRPYTPEAGDAPGQVLAGAFPALLYRIAPEPGRVKFVRRVLTIYRGLLERRPSSIRLAGRSVGALRTRFDRALLAGNEAEAERLYEEILATGRLSLENRHYLRVHLLTGLGKWTAIAAEAPLLRQLADLHLPPQIRGELLDALYRTHIDPVEDPRNAASSLEEFRQKMAPYGRLFATRQGLQQPRVVKAFLMNALLREQPQWEELQALVELLPTDPEDAAFSAALRGLVELRRSAVKPAGSEEADAAFDDMDYDVALQLYAAAPPARRSVARMIQCASTIRTAEAARTTIAAIALIPEIEAALPESVRTILADLRLLVDPVPTDASPASITALAQASSPESWHDWAKWVAEGAAREAATSALDQRCGNWPIAPYLQRQAAEELGQQLTSAALSAADIVQIAFPYLYQAFVGETEEAQPALAPVYAALLTAVVLAPRRTSDDLELARVLTSLLLEAGLSDAEYRNLTSDLTDMIKEDASVNTLDWALDLAEVIAMNRAASSSDQLNLVMAILEFVRTRVHRLAGRQIEIVRALCADMGISPNPYLLGAPEEDPDAGAIAQLAARSIAIYTLTETAGQRALQVLSKLVPGINVSLNSDKVCTERLTALAQNAEFFVFAWRSSKHAAYYCIKEHRPREMRLLIPQGKGTASIIRALLAA